MNSDWLSNPWLLLALVLSTVFFAFVWRSVAVWRQTGHNPYVLPADDTLQGFVGRSMAGLLGALLLGAFTLALVPGAAVHFAPFPWLGVRAVQAAGWSLMLLGLGLTLLAQAQMGHAWRIGLNDAVRTALVQRGLFARSRNPIFLAMRLNLLGLFLAVPNAWSLSLLVAGELLMGVQVRLEEAYLSRVHGPAYAAYQARVPRWL
ncbi:isoprenylcysteine carboxylmethyltransferase family protein (plasmid) [Deinococcus taeanensis]|uniref:methyltransferase family protein n=1 Tax=Deinococcus taeanensis TaxID=2737050 RepID=UPI001CDD7016|nr:isoprenylcysteine carboxylmethyltransferase family protein [Deinococcus taeanensis]UBV44410.1 isoprenylcysteine carboxylmethyltransferase family protein [Deinococcus taeanensis]